jgi:single stranded DNA-binding protein
MPLPIITLDGRVVGDVQFKWLQEGKALARFRMVCADRRKGEDGKWYDAETLWLTISAFGRLAENILDSVNDRDQVIVTGKLSTTEWTDQSGAKRSAQKVVASSVGPSLAFVPRPHHGGDPSTAPIGAERVSRDVTPDTGEQMVHSPGSGDDPWRY